MVSFKNLLPEDTRALELVSSAVLLSLAITVSSVYSLVLILVSILIITGIYLNWYTLRTCTCLVASAVFIHFTRDTTEVSMFFSLLALGISNLYAFLINNQNSKWKR